MSSPTSFADQLAQASHDRLTYDPRHRRLVCHREDGEPAWDVTISEADLRRLLQRLLLTSGTPPRADGLPTTEPLETAIAILLERAAEVSGPPL